MNLKKLLEKKFEDLNVTVDNEYIDIRFYSNLGEDFGFCVENNIDDVISYCKNFDEEEHAVMHIENRGKNGTPSRVIDLVEDAQKIKEKLEEIQDFLEGEMELFQSTLEDYNEFRLEVKRDCNKVINYLDFSSTSEVLDEFYLQSERFKIVDEEEVDLDDELLADIIGGQEYKDFFRLDYENKKMIFMNKEEVENFIKNDEEYKESKNV